MQILIISGFLGSGKTTLLLGLSEFLVRRGERVAIIENEVGEIPVDSSCLKAQGLTVRELYAGCICCSLREDLQKTIMAVRTTYQPDMVIIEPSGIAGPDMAAEAVVDILNPEDILQTIVIVDYRRAAAEGDIDQFLFRVPFVRRSMETCDVLILNIPEQESVAEELFQKLFSAAEISFRGHSLLSADVRDEVDVRRVAGALAGEGSRGNQFDNPEHTMNTHDGRSGTAILRNHESMTEERAATAAYSITRRLDGDEVSAAATVKKYIAGAKIMSGTIAENLRYNYSSSFGHLKCVLETGGQALCMSVTDFNSGEVSVSGSLPPAAERITVVLNGILYGISETVLRAMVHKEWISFLNMIESGFQQSKTL